MFCALKLLKTFTFFTGIYHMYANMYVNKHTQNIEAIKFTYELRDHLNPQVRNFILYSDHSHKNCFNNEEEIYHTYLTNRNYLSQDPLSFLTDYEENEGDNEYDIESEEDENGEGDNEDSTNNTLRDAVKTLNDTLNNSNYTLKDTLNNMANNNSNYTTLKNTLNNTVNINITLNNLNYTLKDTLNDALNNSNNTLNDALNNSNDTLNDALNNSNNTIKNTINDTANNITIDNEDDGEDGEDDEDDFDLEYLFCMKSPSHLPHNTWNGAIQIDYKRDYDKFITNQCANECIKNKKYVMGIDSGMICRCGTNSPINIRGKTMEEFCQKCNDKSSYSCGNVYYGFMSVYKIK